MRVESITIERFRSIERVRIENCGDLNVLIGKNNSGKSNILQAFRAFFQAIEGGRVATVTPLIGDGLDFHRGGLGPIEITVRVAMTDDERVQLIHDIGEEAPQMRYALDGISTSVRLDVTLCVPRPKGRFAYVNKIVLADPLSGVAERLIYEANPAVGQELQQRVTEVEGKMSDIAALRKAANGGNANIRMSLRDGMPPNFAMRRIFEDTLLTKGTQLSVEQILREASSEDKSVNGVYGVYGAFGALASEIETSVQQVELKPLQNKVVTFAGDSSAIPVYVSSLVKRMSETKVHYMTDTRRPIGKDEADYLLTLKVTRGGPEKLKYIQETISTLLGVQIDAFRGSNEDAELDVDDFLVQVNGSGVKEALRLILDVEFREPEILLVEEPEVHLHPGLETSLMRYLKLISSRCQTFMTTHSTNFLDMGDFRSVYLVSKAKDTTVENLDIQSAEASIPSELGIRLSSLFMYDRIVFVEGPSDEMIIREWAAKLTYNLAQANVGFVHLEGARNFSYFAASETLAFLDKRKVKLMFVLDQDERSQQDIDAIGKRLGSRAKLIMLRRREIENYLIDDEDAIVQFLVNKSNTGMSQAVPTKERLHEAIQEVANDLRSLTIAKKIAKLQCRPVFPETSAVFDKTCEDLETYVTGLSSALDGMIGKLQNYKASLVATQERVTAEIEKSWDTHKLTMVPGDNLLDQLCRRFGFRYHKVPDGAAIARLMREDCIPAEIREMMRQLIC